MKKLVILESPYAGTSPYKIIRAFQCWRNVRYARACVHDSLMLGESPIASHILYTQPGILNDNDVTERMMGIEAGLAWRHVAMATVVYTDRGITKGMDYGIDRAKQSGVPVIYRKLDNKYCFDLKLAIQFMRRRTKAWFDHLAGSFLFSGLRRLRPLGKDKKETEYESEIQKK